VARPEPGSDATMTAPSPPPRRVAAPVGLANGLKSRWLEAWVLLVVSLFLVPTLLLAARQRSHRIAERDAWEATLDPTRPDPGLPEIESFDTTSARRVGIGFYMESMEHVSLHDGGWETVLDVWCDWADDPADPGFDPFDHFVPINGSITDSTVLRETHAGGRHYVHRRLGLAFNRTFRVVNFPFDRHLLLASFENTARPRGELLFVPDEDASSVSTRVAAAGFRIVRFHAVENPHSYRTSRGWPGVPATRGGTWSQPRFAIEIERQGWGLLLLMFQALFVAVGVALLACFIKPVHVDPRFGLGVGALFAVVANSYIIGAQMPETGEFSLADFINLLGIGTVFLSLTQSTISLWIYETRGDPASSRRFDRTSFPVILGCFVVSLALLLAGALSHG